MMGPCVPCEDARAVLCEAVLVRFQQDTVRRSCCLVCVASVVCRERYWRRGVRHSGGGRRCPTQVRRCDSGQGELHHSCVCGGAAARANGALSTHEDPFIFFLFRRSHSISFTRAQGIPKCKLGLEGGMDGRVRERLIEF